MRNLASVALLLFALGAGSAFAQAAVTQRDAFKASVAAHALPLDPMAADPEWEQGAMPQPGGFQDVTTRVAAPHKTSIWMLYDAQNLYVRFQAEQNHVPVTATQGTNDVGFGLDDFVGVGIDTSGAGSQVYFFEVTPRGVRYQQASENARYRPQWQAAARVTGSNWSAVLIIPLRAMRIHPGSKQTWRVNFIRNVAADAEQYTWAFDGLMQAAPPGNGWPSFTDARYWAQWTDIAVTPSMLRAVRPESARGGLRVGKRRARP